MFDRRIRLDLLDLDGRDAGPGRGVDADPLALHQAALDDQVQNPAKDLLVHLVRQTRARLR